MCRTEQKLTCLTELNMLNKELKTIFSTETDPAEDDILYRQIKEVRQKMYDDTLSFFAKLYGEDAQETQLAEVAVRYCRSTGCF